MTAEDLAMVVDGEFDNAGDLLGISGLDMNEELLGILGSLDAVKRQKAINRLTKRPRLSRQSRGEMEKFFRQLPKNIRHQLAKGKLRLADTTIYSIKAASSKTIKMFETQDDKEINLRNVSNAKLPKNQALLVSGIYLLAGIPDKAGGTPTTDEIKATDFKSIGLMPALANGEFSLKANKTQIVPETSNRKFVTDNNHNWPMGYYKLDNPRLITDDILIECTIELGTMEDLDADAHLYVGLHGTITTP